YEAGQYAVRGGIIDVFSFAHELPYRIELFGNEVESIRTFDPVTPISVGEFPRLSIVPNLQSQTLKAERQSFFSFLSPDSVLWFKDYQLAGDIIQKSFDAAAESFSRIAGGGKTQVVSGPEVLFDDRDAFQRTVASFPCVEFGSRYFLPATHAFQFLSGAQPSFNKNFGLLTADLERLQQEGYRTFIASDLPHQLDKLKSILSEISSTVTVETLDFSLRAGFQDADM